VEERRVDRFVLAGHSLAGNVVAQYATAHPERVAALCFVDTGRWVATEADLDELRRGFRPDAYEAFTRAHYEQILAFARPGTRELVMRGLRAMLRENFMALMYGGVGYDMRAAAGRYPGPKLALCADAFGMAARWSDTDVAVQTMADVSHWLQLDAPDEVARILDEWSARSV
jgi:pimeloyl-ACP methyl ester carboxylesterase